MSELSTVDYVDKYTETRSFYKDHSLKEKTRPFKFPKKGFDEPSQMNNKQPLLVE